jgi:hypothetical protein
MEIHQNAMYTHAALPQPMTSIIPVGNGQESLNIYTIFVGVDAIDDAPATLLCGKSAEWTATPERQLCQFELFTSYLPWSMEDRQ